MADFFTDPLRLTLAAAAVIVLVGIFFFGRRNPTNRRNEYKETRRAEPPTMSDEVSVEETDTGAFFGNNEYVGPVKTVSRESAEAKTADQRRPAIKREDISEDQFVVLHLIPREGESFSGRDLLQVFRESGLEYGDFKIFHYPHRKDRTKSLFSVVNMVKPGFFDIDKMKDFSTTGLSMFLRLPVYGGENEGTFSSMLATANVMARKLRATVLDQDRKPLDEDRVRKIKQYISYYTRKNAQKTSHEPL